MTTSGRILAPCEAEPHGRKPVILTFVATYVPGYKSGGPVRSIAGVVEALGDEVSFRIVTADRDIGDTQPYSGLATDRWTTVGKGVVYYASRRGRSLLAIRRLLRGTYDVLYLNSFFSYEFAIKPLILRRLSMVPSRPVVLAPRGQFANSALSLGATKKKAFMRVAKLLGLHRRVTWQATSAHEVDDIRRVMGEAVDVRLAEIPPEGIEMGTVASYRPSRGDESLRLVFLGRIAPMKNLQFAIDCLRGVASHVTFDIYGPIADSAYWRTCQAELAALPNNVVVSYRGPVPRSDVHRVLAEYDLFVLPTLGENHGHAILDSLIAGCPVLISDRTPWSRVESAGCGWIRPLEAVGSFTAVLRQCADASESQRQEWSANARRFAQHVVTGEDARRQNMRLFKSVASQDLESRLAERAGFYDCHGRGR